MLTQWEKLAKAGKKTKQVSHILQGIGTHDFQAGLAGMYKLVIRTPKGFKSIKRIHVNQNGVVILIP